MTEEELREKGYVLFGINNDMFVQVRKIGTDEMVDMAFSRREALEKMARRLAQEAP